MASSSAPRPESPASSVFVTLADAGYVEQAKQVFASAYWNGGWRGDFLLLAHEIDESELGWFEERGILVRRCVPLYEGRPGGMPPVLTSKFYLFTPEFKRWRSVIYCDADATVRASLDALLSLEGFWSIKDASRWLDVQILTRRTRRRRGLPPRQHRSLVKELRRHYEFRATPFCAGFFVFRTDLVDESTFPALKAIMDRYHPVSEYGDQLSFNLFFYDDWQVLPPVYNVQVTGETNQWQIPSQEIEGVVIHYTSAEKPWITRNHFFGEWRAMLDQADAIDLSRVPEGRRWTQRQVAEYSAYLDARDRHAPLLGRWIAERVPRRYRRFLWLFAGPALGIASRLRRLKDWLRRSGPLGTPS